MTFDIKALDYKNFALLEKQNQLGTLTFNNYFSQSCGIIRMNNTINSTFKSKGFFRTGTQIIRGNNVIFSTVSNWLGGLKIFSVCDNKKYFLRTKNFWKNTKVLLDETGKEILILSKKYNWKNWNYNYSFVVTAEFDSIVEKELLLFSLMQSDYKMTQLNS